MNIKYLMLLLSCMLLLGCGDNNFQVDKSIEVSQLLESEKIRNKIENGPISIQTLVYPKNPKLGDAITLEITVVAKESLLVNMPPFGEALGRFQIVNFQPQENTEDGNQKKYHQKYILQAPMSGLQKIPPIRIVYVDSTISSEEMELLTDDISIEIQSLLDEDAPLSLSQPKQELIINRQMANLIVPIATGTVLLLLSFLGFWYYRKHQQKVMIQNAYSHALDALINLQSQDFEGRLDEFYAELSLIIRRYISSRYGLKALERTTEEFLTITKSSQDISEEHRLYVGKILQICDMMKFTKEKQSGLDHQTQITDVKKFLDETTPMEDKHS
jgi:hypothetical protein